MQGRIAKIIFTIIFALLLIGINKVVQANSIGKISMDIYVSINGDATVTETWQCSVNEVKLINVELIKFQIE